VLRIRRAALGAEHPEIASALNALAVIARHRGDHDRALPLYERSLEMRRRLLGPDHPEVALSLNNLAVFLRSRGEYAAAEPLYREALEIRRRIYGDEHPRSPRASRGWGRSTSTPATPPRQRRRSGRRYAWTGRSTVGSTPASPGTSGTWGLCT
jgi:tetratricopeptide (TPR) repeat protein